MQSSCAWDGSSLFPLAMCALSCSELHVSDLDAKLLVNGPRYIAITEPEKAPGIKRFC